MLKEIICNIFNEKKVVFNCGLSVVQGDDQATNSIGKSTMLMIIDFVYGGNTYPNNNNDVINNMGHHEFNFCFVFNNKEYYFKRTTQDYNSIYYCDKNYEITNKKETKEYLLFLKEMYGLNSLELSFRGTVSLFLRIWGKRNYILNRPLHSIRNQNNRTAIEYIIKLFNLYEGISSLSEKISTLQNQKRVFLSAESYDYIPTIKKREFNFNIKIMEDLRNQIENLKSEISDATTNTKDLITNEILELKDRKSSLVRKRTILENKLRRNRQSQTFNNKKVENRFEKLNEYFSDINAEKILTLEEFHKDLSKVLNHELKKNERDLLSQLSSIHEEISNINHELSTTLDIEDDSKILIEKLMDLNIELQRRKYENGIYLERQNLVSTIKDTREELGLIKIKILNDISEKINAKIVEINNRIYGKNRRVPRLSFGENNYIYEVTNDTGTGKTYTNLIEFDLAILDLTLLPCMAHDSALFKNIENHAFERIIEIYTTYDKQIFISIDEIQKYNKETQNLLEQNTILKLSDEKVLFKRDWREK